MRSRPRAEPASGPPTTRIGLVTAATLLGAESVAVTILMLVAAAIGCNDEAHSEVRWCDHESTAFPFIVFLLLCGVQVGVVMWGTHRTRETNSYRWLVISAIMANALALITALLVTGAYAQGPVEPGH